MEVSPQARGFSEIHSIEEAEEMRKRFQQLVEEVAIARGDPEIPSIEDAEEMRRRFQQLDRPKDPVEVCTVTGSEAVLRALQDDLRKAGYRKLR